MEFKAGMYARSRDGSIYGPLKDDKTADYPLSANDEDWEYDGTYQHRKVSKLDLIKQVFVSSTPFDEAKLDALCRDIADVITEARVDYPAGREAGPSIEYDEDSIRAILRQAGAITYLGNHPKDLIARTQGGTFKRLHYKIEGILVKDAEELGVETTVMVLDVIDTGHKPEPEAEGLGTVAEQSEPFVNQPPGTSLDLRLTAKLWQDYLDGRGFDAYWADASTGVVEDLLTLHKVATRV